MKEFISMGIWLIAAATLITVLIKDAIAFVKEREEE